jgi:hypothetical protein
MSDIENPPPSSSSQDAPDAAATAPEPSGHGLWAWKERLVAACLTGNNPQQLDDDEAAAVDADQRSRCVFVYLWLVVSLAVSVAFAVLLVLCPSDATRALAGIGMAVGLCCAGFFVDLADRMAQGDTSLHWVIDYLM